MHRSGGVQVPASYLTTTTVECYSPRSAAAGAVAVVPFQCAFSDKMIATSAVAEGAVTCEAPPLTKQAAASVKAVAVRIFVNDESHGTAHMFEYVTAPLHDRCQPRQRFSTFTRISPSWRFPIQRDLSCSQVPACGGAAVRDTPDGAP